MSATLADLARALVDAQLARLVDRVRSAPPDARPGVAVRTCWDVQALVDLAHAWGCPEAVNVSAAVRRLAVAATADGEPCPDCDGEGVVWQERTTPNDGPTYDCHCTADPFNLDVPAHRGRMAGIARDAPSLRQGELGDDADCIECAAGRPVPASGGTDPPDEGS